jgi:hypothetical protein
MTSKIEQRLQELGLSLPAPWSLPGGTLIGSTLVRVQGERVFVGGHVPQRNGCRQTIAGLLTSSTGARTDLNLQNAG